MQEQCWIEGKCYDCETRLQDKAQHEGRGNYVAWTELCVRVTCCDNPFEVGKLYEGHIKSAMGWVKCTLRLCEVWRDFYMDGTEIFRLEMTTKGEWRVVGRAQNT